ncbi:MAG: acyl-CoA dehydrogenase [Gammaproteobacteria bacterium CG22_combo_CG10-13_8_21_14_all_40_8]|nr:MAG: acyl-CoA dehydrogenase [Gammaproteobacteria bacterium CG22_combo_CG10-13_8_21_14_all_40_8]
MLQAFCWFLGFVLTISVLAYHRASMKTYTLTFFSILFVISIASSSPYIAWLIYFGWFIPLNIKPIRQKLVSNPIFKLFKKLMPPISETEQEALEAGTVWWEAELFRGAPDWKQLHDIPQARLSPKEIAFLEGPVETLCSMVNDWNVTHENADLSPETWRFIKDNGFFGMIIPKKFGGLELSAYAHSRVLIKLNSVSATLGTMVSVPNSLGPAELLLHYGTKQQKDHYLPKLAKGEEIPCFALTGPEAGSDASAIPDEGIVCQDIFEGKEVLGIRLNWDKRYITLAPVATVLGLAFKLYDPKKLLGGAENYGITCALIPINLPGITIGRRHYPLNIPFQNGPTQGKDVFIPIDFIIGGPTQAGKGWKMLVDCLSAGRAISLPSGAIASAKVSAISSGAYARIRKQFHLPIGKMEGVEEALARIGGYAYVNAAVGAFTCAGIDIGEKPSVASAIVKYHTTENARRAVMDGMDIHGGKSIMLGPKNYLGRAYQSAPISITVEGANILTRSLIIFGQGSLRCHPYLLKEVKAVHNPDPKNSLDDFDQALFAHLGFAFSNFIRSAFLGLTGGRGSQTPFNDVTARYYQHMKRFSANLAFLSDVVFGALGGEVKRRERISARLGDILSGLYLGSAILKRFDDEGRHHEDIPLVCYAMESQLYQIQEAIFALFNNFPITWLGTLLKFKLYPFGRPITPPSDYLAHKVSTILMQPSETRTRLGEGIYLSPTIHNNLGKMESVLKDIIASEAILSKLKGNIETKETNPIKLSQLALAAGLINQQSADLIERAEIGRQQVIAVDDFDSSELKIKNK